MTRYFTMSDLKIMLSEFIATILIFLIGVFYSGDAPKNIDITCEIPSGVTEYHAGDTVEFSATVKNTGRPFVDEYYNNIFEISIYTEKDGERITILPFFPDDERDYVDATKKIPILKGAVIREKNFSFVVPDDAPAGTYTVVVRWNTLYQTFENMMTVK